MHSFTYGSRVIENEQQVRLERNVRKIGNLLHAVVRFFVTFFLFILINILLSNILQHAHLTLVYTLRLLNNITEVLLNESALSVIYFAYNHSVYILLAFTFTCIYLCSLVLRALVKCDNKSEKGIETYCKENQKFSKKISDSTISYRHKVCFLS